MIDNPRLILLNLNKFVYRRYKKILKEYKFLIF